MMWNIGRQWVKRPRTNTILNFFSIHTLLTLLDQEALKVKSAEKDWHESKIHRITNPCKNNSREYFTN